MRQKSIISKTFALLPVIREYIRAAIRQNIIIRPMIANIRASLECPLSVD